MPPPHGTAAEARSYSGIGNGRDRHPPARPTYTPPPKGGGGDGAHLRRKTTFAPKTKTVTPKDTRPFIPLGGITGSNRFKNWATKFNINRPKEPSAWERFLNHRLNTQLMKRKVEGSRIPGTDEYTAPTYTHALGGYDWKQNFPNTPELLDKALAYGYQHLTEGTRALTDPTSYGTGIFGLTQNLSNAFSKANIEAAKNIQGFTDEGIPREAMQKYQAWQNLARGGIVNLLYGGFI